MDENNSKQNAKKIISETAKKYNTKNLEYVEELYSIAMYFYKNNIDFTIAKYLLKENIRTLSMKELFIDTQEYHNCLVYQHTLANVNLASGDLQQAEQYYKLVLTKIEPNYNTYPDIYLEVLINLANLIKPLGKERYLESKIFYSKALEFQLEISQTNTEQYYLTIRELAILNLQTGFIKDAKELFQEALEIVTTDAYELDRATLSYYLALTYIKMYLYEHALYYLRLAYKDFKRLSKMDSLIYSLLLQGFGRCCALKNKYALAEKLYNKSLKVYCNEKSEYDENIYNIEYFLAELKLDEEKLDEAERSYINLKNNCLIYFGRKSSEYGNCLCSLALIYTYLEKYTKAKRLLKISGRIFENDNNRESKAECFKHLGNLYLTTGKYAKSEQMYKKHLDIIDETISSLSIAYAEGLFSLANLYVSMTRWNDAEHKLNNALDILSKLQKESSLLYADCLCELADVNFHNSFSNFIESESLIARAIKIYNDKSAQNTINYSKLLNGISTIYILLEKYSDAEDKIKESIEIKRNILGENNSIYATSIGELGSFYLKIGKSEEALLLYTNSRSIFEKLKIYKPISYCMFSLNIGYVYYTTGKCFEAKQEVKNAFELLEETGCTLDSVEDSLNHLLSCIYVKEGKYNKAEKLLKSILKNTEKNKDLSYVQNSYALADLFYKNGDYKESETRFIELLNFQSTLGLSSSYVINSLHTLALVYIGMENHSEALYKSIAAIKTCNNLIYSAVFGCTKESISALKSSLSPFFNLFFSILANYLPTGINPEEYLPIIIDRKFNELHISGIMKNITSDAALLDANKQLEYNKIKNKISTEMYKNKNQKIYSQNNLQKFNNELWMFESKIAGDLFKNSGNVYSNDTSDTSEKLFNKDEVIIEFIAYNDFFHNNHTGYYALIIFNKQKEKKLIYVGDENQIDVKVHRIQANIKSLSQNNNKLHSLLLNKGFKSVRDINLEIDSQTELLYKNIDELKLALLNSISPFIKNVKNITICPDGELAKTPFELILPQHKIRYLTSYSDEKWMSLSTHKNGSDVVMGHPICNLKILKSKTNKNDASNTKKHFDNDILKFKKAGFPMYDLAYSNLECIKVSERINCTNVITGHNFTKDAFINMKAPRILHISTHGFFFEKENSQNELNSVTISDVIDGVNKFDNPYERCGLAVKGANLVLENNKYASAVLIYGSDIINKDLTGTELVVLSACDTALGDIKSGQGVYGFQRAFLLSGVKTLVMSLWSVDDLATCILMDKLYYEINKGHRVDFALSEAKNFLKTATITALIKDGWELQLNELNIIDCFTLNDIPYKSPYYWAGFICLGNGREIITYSDVVQ